MAKKFIKKTLTIFLLCSLLFVTGCDLASNFFNLFLDECGTDQLITCCTVHGDRCYFSDELVSKSFPEGTVLWNSDRNHPDIEGLQVCYSRCMNYKKLKEMGYYPLFQKGGRFVPPPGYPVSNSTRWDFFGDVRYGSE